MAADASGGTDVFKALDVIECKSENIDVDTQHGSIEAD